MRRLILLARRLILLALISSLPSFAAYLKTGTATVQSGQITGTQTNFPALMTTTSLELAVTGSGGNIQNTCTQTVGTESLTVPCDLVFASDVGCLSLYSWEFESYTSTTGALIVWINVSSIAAATVVHICYDNVSVSTLQTTPASTWNTNAKLVWHEWNGSSLNLSDSTSNANNGTGSGTSVPTGTTGMIDGGSSHNGNGTLLSYILSGSSPFDPSATDFSAFVWVKPTSFTNSGGSTVFAQNNGSGTGRAWLVGTQTTGEFSVALGGVAQDCGLAMTAAAWQLVGITKTGTTIKCYKNGVAGTTLTATSETASGTIIVGIGKSLAANSNFNGLMDQVQLSNTLFSANWIAAMYNNQFAPNSFFTVVVGNPIMPEAVGGGANVI